MFRGFLVHLCALSVRLMVEQRHNVLFESSFRPNEAVLDLVGKCFMIIAPSLYFFSSTKVTKNLQIWKWLKVQISIEIFFYNEQPILAYIIFLAKTIDGLYLHIGLCIFLVYYSFYHIQFFHSRNNNKNCIIISMVIGLFRILLTCFSPKVYIFFFALSSQ